MNQIITDTATVNKSWLKYAENNFSLNKNYLPRYLTGEDIRLSLTEFGLQEPSHPNVWGIFIANLARKGLIVPTGGYAPTLSAASHGRKVQLYARK